MRYFSKFVLTCSNIKSCLLISIEIYDRAYSTKNDPGLPFHPRDGQCSRDIPFDLIGRAGPGFPIGLIIRHFQAAEPALRSHGLVCGDSMKRADVVGCPVGGGFALYHFDLH